MARMELHSHSDMSNIRLIDCINTVDSLVDYAVEIGLEGICLTDHEALGNWVKLDQKRQKIQEEMTEQSLEYTKHTDQKKEFMSYLVQRSKMSSTKHRVGNSTEKR